MLNRKSFLELVWQHGMFDHQVVRLTDGRAVEVLTPGIRTEGGRKGLAPEFVYAQLRVVESGQILSGSVKIDVLSSDWREQGTVGTEGFEGVVAHYVDECDVQVMRGDTMVHTIEARIPAFLDERARKVAIECKEYFEYSDNVYRENLLSRLTTDRLERKGNEILELLEKTNGDWAAATMQAFIIRFGYKDSKIFYKQLAELIPYYVIRDRACEVKELEALFFGMAGVLDSELSQQDKYTWELNEIFKRQCDAFRLSGRVSADAKGRVRPTSHPHLQLARMAAILVNETSLFERITKEEGYLKIRDLFKVKLSDYWSDHLQLGYTNARTFTKISEERIDRFIINFVVPILHAYGRYSNDEEIKERALDFLCKTPVEVNSIVNSWRIGDYIPLNAFHTQALIQLTEEYCKKGGSHCYYCPLGAESLGAIYKKSLKR